MLDRILLRVVDMQRFPEMAKKITPEAGVLRACLDLLAAEHVFAGRVNLTLLVLWGQLFKVGPLFNFYSD